MFGNFSLFKTPFPGRNSVPPSFVPFFVFYIFFLPPFEDLGCFSGCLMSCAGIQKLFCGIYSAFKCSFDEFVGEKVISPSYSSAILAPPAYILLKTQFWEELRWRRSRMGEHFLPHKFIKRTFKRQVNSTKQLLNAGREHQAPREATQVFKRR